MMNNTIPLNPDKTFMEGYLDGWHEIEPGTNPSIPPYAVPDGKTAYQHGFELGVEAVKKSRGDKPEQ
jgi:hypothetical protein